MGRVDTRWLGENCSWQAVEHANRIMDFRDKFGEERVIDVHYADLMRRPIETMRQLYRALGDDYTDEAETSMASLINNNPQDKFGRTQYKLPKYGQPPDPVQT